MTKLLLTTLSILFIATTASAETVTLKSGRVVEGTIIERTNDKIKVDTGSGIAVIYAMDEVANIFDERDENGDGEVSEEELENWNDDQDAKAEELIEVERLLKELKEGNITYDEYLNKLMEIQKESWKKKGGIEGIKDEGVRKELREKGVKDEDIEQAVDDYFENFKTEILFSDENPFNKLSD